jgi:thiamine pyrophosphokinase
VYPTDKDATDGELALGAAVESGARRITLVTGGRIDRLDHLLAVVALLGHPITDGIEIAAYVGNAQLQRVRHGEPADLSYPIGSTVTLLPLFGTVYGVSTIGLQWPLVNAELSLGTSRGVSNIVQQTPARVSVNSGTLLVISPEALS